MTAKTIPAKVILVCDRCNAEGMRGEEGSFHYGGMHARKVEEWSRSYDGSAGGITRDIDLCSACAYDFSQFMSEKPSS